MTHNPLRDAAKHLESKGRYGDTMLVHLNPKEVKFLASMSPTGSLTVNPHTGLQEAFLPALLAPIVGGLAGGWALPALGWGSAALGAGLGSGLASFAATGDLAKGVTSGLLGYGLGSATDLLAAGAEGIAPAAGEAAKEAAKNTLATQAATGAGLNTASMAPDALRTLGDADLVGYGMSQPSLAGSGLNAATKESAAQAITRAGQMTPWDRFGAAAENATNPDVLKNTFWTNASRTTMPIAGGVMGSMMMNDQAQSSAPPPYQYQTNYSYPGNQGTGRRYQYQAPDPMGRERQYFYAGGGGVEGFDAPRYYEDRPKERFHNPRDYEDYPKDRFYLPRDRYYEDRPRDMRENGPPRNDGGMILRGGREPERFAGGGEIDPGRGKYEQDDRYDFVPRKPEGAGLKDRPRKISLKQAEEWARQTDAQRDGRGYGGVTSRNPMYRDNPPIIQYAKGGYIGGPGGGLDDAIPAVIDGRQPAKLSSGEYVVPAHAVSALGNGSTEHGVRELDKMVDRTMQGKFGTKNRKPRPIKAENMMAGLGAMRGRKGKGGGKKAPGPFEFSGGGWIDRLLGREQGPGRSWDQPSGPTPWPTREDVAAARAYKERWGNSNEQEINPPREMNTNNDNVRYFAPGSGLNVMGVRDAERFINSEGKIDNSRQIADVDMADRLYAAQLAANSDPVSYLGADHTKIRTVYPHVREDKSSGLNGEYLPNDTIMWNGLRDTTPVHEYMHRGLQQMRNADPDSLKEPLYGKMSEPYREEYLVRRMMQNRFGPVEVGTNPALLSARKDDPDMDKYMRKVRKKANEMVAKKVIEREGGVK